MPASQTRRTVLLAALALAATALLLAVLLRAAPVAHAAQNGQATEASAGAERWLHVTVNCKNENGERVRINLPFSLARGVLASIQQGRLNHGIVHIEHAHMNDVDMRALLKAVKSAQDAEFVTVEGKDSTVNVRKQGTMLLIHVVDKSPSHKFHSNDSSPQNVDVRVPLEVADALFSGAPDELNIGAALDLLARHGDMELVSVQDSENTVRIWMDTKTTQD